METVMNKHHELIERWGAALMGTVLVALPVAGWIHRGSLGRMDIVVALIGMAALVLAVEDFRRRRHLARILKAPRAGGRHTVCPRSGEPLMGEV
jgi:hypothetical protein